MPTAKLLLYIVATVALAGLVLNYAACAAQFFRRDLWAGPLLLSLRKNVRTLDLWGRRAWWACVMAAWMGIIVSLSYRQIKWVAITWGLGATVWAVDFRLRDQVELRENGLVYSTDIVHSSHSGPLNRMRFVKWEDIASWTWETGLLYGFYSAPPSEDYLSFTIQWRGRPRKIKLRVERKLRESAEAILQQRVSSQLSEVVS